MPESTVRLPVAATAERLWQVLQDKVVHPDGYIHRASDPRVLEQHPDGCVRRMVFRGLELLERITIDPVHLEIRFVLLGNPIYQGHVVNRILCQGDRIFLELVRHWRPRDPEVDPLDSEEMVRSLEHTAGNLKRRAEAGEGAHA
jgi:hypothetical protein